MLREIFGEPVPECCLGVSSAEAGLEGKGIYTSYTTNPCLLPLNRLRQLAVNMLSHARDTADYVDNAV